MPGKFFQALFSDDRKFTPSFRKTLHPLAFAENRARKDAR